MEVLNTKLYPLLLVGLINLVSGSAVAGRCIDCTIKAVGCSYLWAGRESCNIILEQEIVSTDSDHIPACSKNFPNRMVFDVTRSGGKAMLSVALAAQASGEKVEVYGNKNCDLYPSFETLKMLYITK